MSPKLVSVFFIGFMAGVAGGSLYIAALNWLLFWLFVGLFAAMLVSAFSRSTGVAVLLMTLGLATGWWYVNRSFEPNQYSKYISVNINAEGTVSADPVTVEKNQQITLLPDGFGQQIRAQLYTPIPDIRKGDRVWIRGQLELPENFSDFDYVGYLQRWNVYAVLKKPRVIVLRRAKTSWRTPLLAIRKYVIKRSQAYPQSEGSLIVGMLIGQRQNIPKPVSDSFRITGLTHIVAVSGFNMTIIATACGVLVWYIGRRATNITTLAIIFGFVVITGASAAVVRAGIMSTLMVVAQLFGRQYASGYSLLTVAAIMILHNPRIVMWDVGFQLSVAATYGVLASFQIKRPDSKPASFISEMMRPTLGAIAMTAPIIAWHFGTFSIIAPLANLVVLPLVPWIMLLGALSLLPLIGGVFVYPAQMVTATVLKSAGFFAGLPYANVEVALPLWVLGIYYLAVFAVIHKRNSAKISLQNQVKDAKL